MHTAAILAGGNGRRLGGVSKPLLSVGDKRIIDRQLITLQLVVDHIAIVANDQSLYSDLDITVWPDLFQNCGPLGGLLTALLNAKTSQVLIIAGDMPFLSIPILTRLLQLGRSMDVAIPRSSDGLQPLCGSYRSDCAPTIRRNIEAGILKVHDILPLLNVCEIQSEELSKLNPQQNALFKINTLKDYARAQTLAQRYDT